MPQDSKNADKEEQDAMQVDWFVLSAAMIGLAVVIGASMQAGSDGLAYNVASYLSGSAAY